MKIQFLQKQYTAWLVPVLCLGIALLHGIFLYGGSSGRDDAYITYGAAQALSEFKKFVNYNGEAVEQSTSNVLNDHFNYPVHIAPLPKELPFFCHYHVLSWIRGEPKLNQLISELANTYSTIKKRLLSSPEWAYLLEPYTLTEKFLYSTKRQIKAFKYHTKKYSHINSTLDQKNANVLGHSSGIETR